MIRRKRDWKLRVGGDQHTGWLPEGAATPLPEPVREVAFNLQIEFDGSGYLLVYATTDGTLHGDDWYEDLAGAERAAAEGFGIGVADWDPSG